MKDYDIVILGAGPAGLSAAIYSARYSLKTLVIGRELGGMASSAHKIENYPGHSGSGLELMKKFHEQAISLGAEFIADDLIDIQKEKGFEVITGRKERIRAKTVIIALGTQKRKLNVLGEDKFLGKGVSYCATCDACFFRKKKVAVIGGGEAGCKAAELLADMAEKVYLVFRSEKENCSARDSKVLRSMENLEILNNTEALEIQGKEKVSGLLVLKNKKKEKIEVDGIFIEIGSLPVSDICKILSIKTDEKGYILADKNMKTSVKGIFAAGDIVQSELKQIVLAAAQGAIAAKSAYEFLKK